MAACYAALPARGPGDSPLWISEGCSYSVAFARPIARSGHVHIAGPRHSGCCPDLNVAPPFRAALARVEPGAAPAIRTAPHSAASFRQRVASRDGGNSMNERFSGELALVP